MRIPADDTLVTQAVPAEAEVEPGRALVAPSSALLDLARVERFGFGERIAASCESTDGALGPLGGRRVVRAGDAPLAGEDRLGAHAEVTLAVLLPGDTFGDLEEDAAVDVRAKREAVVAFLDEAALARAAGILPELTAIRQNAGRRRRVLYALGASGAFVNLPEAERATLLDSVAEVSSPPSGEAPRTAPAPSAASAATPGVAALAPTQEHPYATSDGRFTSDRARVRRVAFVQQFDETDCAAACLAMICRHFGRRVSTSRIRTIAGGGTQGTSLAAVCRTARELGLAARSAAVSAEHLEQLPLPAIIHWENRHWVVLVECSGDTARIADPATGVRTISRAELLAAWTGAAALFDFTEAFTAREDDRLRLRWLWPYFAPFRSVLLKAVLLSLVVAGLTMLLPVVTQVIIDRVVVDAVPDLLASMAGLMAIVFVVVTAARVLNGYLMAFVAARVDAAILDVLIDRLLALPLPYFLARRTGDIQRRLAGARDVRETLVKIAVTGVLALVQFNVAAILMAVYSPLLMLTFLSMAPIYALMMHLSARYVVPIFRKLEEERGRYQSDQLDAIKGIETIKVAGAEAQVRQGLLERFLVTARQQFSADYARLAYDGVVHGAGGGSQVLFLWVGASLAIEGQLTVGGFVAFSFLVMLANEPIFSCLSLWEEYKRSEVLIHRLSDVFEAEAEQGSDRSHLMPVHALHGAVELRGVTFAYPGIPDRPVIKDLNLAVSPGERVAIVGRSGCGKSTLVKVLSGLVEPSAGTLRYDSTDSRVLNYRDLRRNIGFVLQDIHVFSGSILENIALGEEPDFDRAKEAARVADAHGFIAALPETYHTQIGESGLRLSGGQMQRIAIARALYKKPSIFIFDEATSALDTDSERTIQDNLSRVFEGATVFVIAHRLSTVRDADRIVVLEQGEIVEQGSHDQLIARHGLYFELVNRQGVL